jgi:hypothetical protein
MASSFSILSQSLESYSQESDMTSRAESSADGAKRYKARLDKEMPVPQASRRRAVLERSATSTVVKGVKAVPRPTYPTFLSSRSTRRTSWARNDSGEVHDVGPATRLSKERQANALSAGLIEAPRLTRKATYSSLPPSPTGAIRVENDGLRDLSAQSHLEFASLTLGIDPHSDDILAQAIQRIASRRDSTISLESAEDRLRAASLHPEEFFSSGPPISISLQSLPNLRRNQSDDDPDEEDHETGSIGAAEGELNSPRSAGSTIGDEHDEDDIFEDAFFSHDGSPIDESLLLSGSMGDSTAFRDKAEQATRLSWWDVLREAVVEEEEHALEIQGKWHV